MLKSAIVQAEKRGEKRDIKANFRGESNKIRASLAYSFCVFKLGKIAKWLSMLKPSFKVKSQLMESKKKIQM